MIAIWLTTGTYETYDSDHADEVGDQLHVWVTDEQGQRVVIAQRLLADIDHWAINPAPTDLDTT